MKAISGLLRAGVAIGAVVAVALPAWGQSLDEPVVSRRRGLLVIGVQGNLPPGAGGERVEVRLRLGGRAALHTPVEVRADGGFSAELVTPRLLLPEDYLLEVGVPGGAALAVRPLELGTAAEREAAAVRLGSWQRGALGTLRDLTATLERRGSYHRALAAEGRGEAEYAREAFEVFLTDTWLAALRAARMDLWTYEQRLLLAPAPEVGEELGRIVALLEVRVGAWRDALRPGARSAPPPNEAVEAAAARLLAILGQPSARLEDWRAGRLGKPPTGRLEAGVHHGDDGFALAVPPGFEVQRTRSSPVERFAMRGPDVTCVVRVRELPDAATPEELSAALELSAWEEWQSYNRLEGRDLAEGAGHRLEFEALVERRLVRVVQRALFPPGGRRVYTLIVARPREAAPWAGLSALEESFRLEEPR